VYRIRDTLDGEAPSVFDEVVDSQALDSCQTYDYSDDLLTARLYLPRVHPQFPRWASFVRSGFADATLDLGVANQALIVASVRRYNRDRLFAISFGHARFLIRHELIEPAFGRRVALNLLYEEDIAAESDQSRIRQVDARTIEANVRRSRVQRSRDTIFETFGVDPQRDLLDRIVGVPWNVEKFGRRISGASSLHLEVDIDFGQLGTLLRRLLTLHGRTTYRDHFSWVDRVRAVDDPVLLDRLRDRTVELAVPGVSEIDLAPPEIVDWDRIAAFTFEIGNRAERDDLRLDDYLEAVERSRTRELDYRRLLAHRVTARDGDGGVVAQWSVARTLFGEFELDGAHYVLDDGNYFVVAGDYLEELNDFIGAIATPTIALPATAAAVLEDAYNKSVAADGGDRLLLDKKTVQPAMRTTPIEICDVMTSHGELIHVKRKLGSSDLSHLFSQGYVSAETIHAGPDLRASVRAKIDEQAQVQRRDAAKFCHLLDEPFSPSGLTVVYAILADWQGKPPRDRMPFFSKVNLRHDAQQIARMGFNLAFAAIDAA
jgi:uncharacterized protein (TIGR04141 family)